MPLYEYECQACGDRSEVIQRFSDDPLTTCEICGGELRKLLSAPSFQLKGSGWYKTDYASPSKSSSKSSDSTSSSDTDSSSGKKDKDSKSSSSSSADSSSSSSAKTETAKTST